MVYATGKLIDIEDKKRRYLVARFGEVEIKEDNPKQDVLINESKNSCKLDYGASDIDKALHF